jgi:hypothetical protein
LQFRPSDDPAPQVYRDVTAEHLFGDRQPAFVYRFRGGLMKCWAHISLDGKVETVGPADCFMSFKDQLPLDRAEGYFGLLGPAVKEDTFTLVAGVTRYSSPDRRDSIGAFTLVPERPKPGGSAFEPTTTIGPSGSLLSEPARGSAQREVSAVGVAIPPGEWVKVQPGIDVLLLEYWAGNETSAGKKAGGQLGVRLWVRFYTKAELK